nr:uncharacterized protein LOC117273496 [Nicotiana tomentosiformis]
MNEGKFTTRIPSFNGKYYNCWKDMMENFSTAEDYKLWNIILDRPNIPIKLDAGGREIPKERSKFNDIDCKLMEKNVRAKKIFICVLGYDECNRVSACRCKGNFGYLQTAHEGTSQVMF